ncbi:hypothetical protein D3C84_1132060 [compost metagenome]
MHAIVLLAVALMNAAQRILCDLLGLFQAVLPDGFHKLLHPFQKIHRSPQATDQQNLPYMHRGVHSVAIFRIS